MSLALSRVATGPEAAGRLCRGAANAVAALWDLKTPAPVAASPLHQLLSRRELAGGRFVGVETSEIGERTPPPTPAPNERVQEERLCVCARVIRYTSSGRSQPDLAAPAPRSAGTPSPDLESDLLPVRLSPPPPARLWSSSALMGLHFLPPTPLGVALFFPDGLRVPPVSKEPREPTLVGAEGGDSRL